jgi:hypothetical protein
MEDFDPARDTLVVVLTTSNMKYSNEPWTVIVPDGSVEGLSGDSLIDCNNYYELRASIVGSRQCSYVGPLPDNMIRQVDEALKYASKVPVHLMLRIAKHLL